MSPGLNKIWYRRTVEDRITALADAVFDFIYNILCAGRPAFESIKVSRRLECGQREVKEPCLKSTKGGEKPSGEE